jgi:hypothetical protein
MVWQESSADAEGGERWRFRLADPPTNHKRVFASPLALIAALKEGVLATQEEVERWVLRR